MWGNTPYPLQHAWRNVLAMPDAPQATPEKKMVAAIAPHDTSEADDTQEDGVLAVKGWARSHGMSLALGGAAFVLLLVAVALWVNVGDRDTLLLQGTSRLNQAQAAVVSLQAQVDADKAAAVRIQKRMEEVRAESVLRVSDLDKVKSADVDLQNDLEKARLAATDFQTRMENAKVVSIKHQGEVEIALAQAAVLQAQLNKALADTAEAQAQLLASKAETAGVQLKLDDDERQLDKLLKRPSKT